MGLFDFFKSKKKNITPAPALESVATVTETVEPSGAVLDCRGLRCPMPIVKIAEGFKKLEPGESLTVLATDPAFRADVEAWIRKTGNVMIDFSEGEIKKAVIQKPLLN